MLRATCAPVPASPLAMPVASRRRAQYYPVSLSSQVAGKAYKTYPPIPSYWSTMEWYFHNDGRCETVINVMPRAEISRTQLSGRRHTGSVIIHHLFNFKRDRTSTFIKNGVLMSAIPHTATYLGSMIKQPRHGNPLFIAPTQRISPFPH